MATKAHWDAKDLQACAVLVIGSHHGGDLVFYEPGLVFPLKEGDLIIFFSGKITHFNLLFKGQRASLVLHSDCAGKQWVENRMKWQSNIFLAM